MKICHFEYNNETHWGAIKNDSVFPLDSLETASEDVGGVTLDKFIKIENVKFLPPAKPSKIVCIGRNYVEHAAELGNEVPKEPLLFLKAPSAIITEGEPITIPSQSLQVEHEGELAVVIGRSCKNLNETDDPFDFIFGYTCLNDVTARDLQKKDVQFTRAKSFDTFCPIGSFIETELDVSDLRVCTRVNGEIKQDGRTSQMVFPVAFLIRYISNQMTLNAGDIIATGTPSGVSKLTGGDVCEIEIEGIGIFTEYGQTDMKRCPNCNADYFDDMLEFCLEDGAKLLSVSKLADDAPTVTRQNRPNPFTEKTLNLPFTADAKTLDVKDQADIRAIVSNDSTIEKVSPAASKVLEVLPVIIALAHNWWQWLYLNNQYYSSISNFLISANFLMWLLLLAAGVAVSLLIIKRHQNKGFAFVSLVVLSINLILFLVPKR